MRHTSHSTLPAILAFQAILPLPTAPVLCNRHDNPVLEWSFTKEGNLFQAEDGNLPEGVTCRPQLRLPQDHPALDLPRRVKVSVTKEGNLLRAEEELPKVAAISEYFM